MRAASWARCDVLQLSTMALSKLAYRAPGARCYALPISTMALAKLTSRVPGDPGAGPALQVWSAGPCLDALCDLLGMQRARGLVGPLLRPAAFLAGILYSRGMRYHHSGLK